MKSEYIRREIEAAARGTKYLIIPVILEQAADLPEALQTRQWLDLTGKMDVETAVAEIANAVRDASTRKSEAIRRISADEAQQVAAQVANEVRGVKVEETAAPEAVFLVHGRDLLLLNEVVSFLGAQGVRTVVLTMISGAEQSLFQKFLKCGGEARFAIVLFSADDLGAARLQYEHVGVGEKALQFRARQNVILELGFFTDGSVGRTCSHFISLLMKCFQISNFHPIWVESCSTKWIPKEIGKHCSRIVY